jgi:hypothetical protein
MRKPFLLVASLKQLHINSVTAAKVLRADAEGRNINRRWYSPQKGCHVAKDMCVTICHADKSVDLLCFCTCQIHPAGPSLIVSHGSQEVSFQLSQHASDVQGLAAAWLKRQCHINAHVLQKRGFSQAVAAWSTFVSLYTQNRQMHD